MTSQQRADEWLWLWRALRSLGYTPAEREALIERAVSQLRAGVHSFVIERRGN